MTISVTLENAYLMAKAVAEQGGLFASIKFQNQFPTAEDWYESLPEWRKQGITRTKFTIN